MGTYLTTGVIHCRILGTKTFNENSSLSHKKREHRNFLSRDDFQTGLTLTGLLVNTSVSKLSIQPMKCLDASHHIIMQITLHFRFTSTNCLLLFRMREEVDEVLGDREDLTWDDVNKLEYIHCVFKETLRILPVAPASCRIIPHETVIDGIRLPAGSPIMVIVHSVWFLDGWLMFTFNVTPPFAQTYNLSDLVFDILKCLQTILSSDCLVCCFM